MTRRAARFSQVEVTRVVKGMLQAGLSVTEIRIDAEGFTVLTRKQPAHGAGHQGRPEKSPDSRGFSGAAPSYALDASQVAMARLDAIYGRDDDETHASAAHLNSARARRAVKPQIDPIKEYYDRIGFDPLTMNDSDFERLHNIEKEKWRASLPGSPLSKWEQNVLRKLQGFEVGALIDPRRKGLSGQTGERLVIRGFIEVRYCSSAPSRIEGYILTEAGFAAVQGLSP
jgi:hypothetical protein